MTDRELIYKFIVSLCLADHLGDVGNDISEVLELLGDNVEWEDLSDLMHKLGKRGITTLLGTTVVDDE